MSPTRITKPKGYSFRINTWRRSAMMISFIFISLKSRRINAELIEKLLPYSRKYLRNFFTLCYRIRIRMIRRQSYSSILSSGEPQIIVEESTLGEEEAERRRNESPPRCLDPDSPSLNPFLLSPWRETRKHSLPTPSCTSGITASQVSSVDYLRMHQ